MTDLITKVFETQFGFWHYQVLLYNEKDWELWEMSRPLDRNWVCIILSYGRVEWEEFISENTISTIIYTMDEFGKEISIDEFMDSWNLDIRTAIKTKQEQFTSYF